MVSTRNHPRQFPPPELSPVKASPSRSTRSVSRKSTRASSVATRDDNDSPEQTPYGLRRRALNGRVVKQEEDDNDSEVEIKDELEDERDHSRATSVFTRDETPVPVKRSSKAQREGTPQPAVSQQQEKKSEATAAWSHTPSFITLGWLAISLPLVIWDSGYVLGRPHTMPGGKWHAPIWTPYALYGTVDYFYGWPAIEENDGWTGAQGMLNVVETAMYLWYLWIIYQNGRTEMSKSGRGAPDDVPGRRKLSGRHAASAVVIGFTASVLTLSKTILYFLNDYSTGFRHTRHNDWQRLIVLWMIPNGAWIVFPIYMTYVFGLEILEGLSVAAGAVGSFGV